MVGDAVSDMDFFPQHSERGCSVDMGGLSGGILNGAIWYRWLDILRATGMIWLCWLAAIGDYIGDCEGMFV